jgi:hypothetical protein
MQKAQLRVVEYRRVVCGRIDRNLLQRARRLRPKRFGFGRDLRVLLCTGRGIEPVIVRIQRARYQSLSHAVHGGHHELIGRFGDRVARKEHPRRVGIDHFLQDHRNHDIRTEQLVFLAIGQSPL